MLEQDVVARVELDELRAWDARRQQPPLLERDRVVATRVQDKRRTANLAEPVLDVHVRSRSQHVGRRLWRRRLATELVEPAHLIVGAFRNESRRKELTEYGVLAIPSKADKVDHRVVLLEAFGAPTMPHPARVRTIENQPRD